MAIDSLDGSPPPFFRQGLSPTSRWVLLGMLSVALMSADHRLGLSGPIRSAISVVLAPVQWLVLQPSRAQRALQAYLQGADEARDAATLYQTRTIAQTQRLQQVELLLQENRQLRQLLALREDLHGPAKATQVLYDTSDPYTRSVVVDKGTLSGVALGAAVVDAAGVVGQVTRTYPLSSEVTLLTSRELSIPVLNTRTGQRFVAMGEPHVLGGSLELKFVPTSADMQVGDLLATSGIDGVYPAGLHVAQVRAVDRRVDTAFAKVHATPTSRPHGRHMLILPPAALWPSAVGGPAPAPAPRQGANPPHSPASTPSAAKGAP